MGDDGSNEHRVLISFYSVTKIVYCFFFLRWNSFKTDL